MKYIISVFVVLIFIGCGDETKSEVSAVSKDTQTLQPQVEDKNLQPPKPPSL